MVTITWFSSSNSQHVGEGVCEGVRGKGKLEVGRSTRKLLEETW